MYGTPAVGLRGLHIGQVVVDEDGALALQVKALRGSGVDGWIGLDELEVARKDTVVKPLQKSVITLQRCRNGGQLFAHQSDHALHLRG